MSAKRVFQVSGLAALFLITHLANYFLLQSERAKFVANDVSYYGANLFQLIEHGREVMTEYPMPAVWIMKFLYQLGGGWQTWTPYFVVAMLLIDALVAISLYRQDRVQACLFWILFTAANGAIAWYRFDLIPAAFVAWGCAWLATKPFRSGAAFGLGAAVKLWPALLIVPLLSPKPAPGTTAFRRLLGFLCTGVGLGIVSLLAVGWHRSASPLTWQADRGLQIESVPATPLMFLRTFTHDRQWAIELSKFNALELIQPTPENPHIGGGVHALLAVSTVLTVGSLLLTVVLTYRLMRAYRSETDRFTDAALLCVLAVVLATIVANKTLSPQYILWLGGPVAALLLRRPPGWLQRPTRVISVATVMIAALTQYTYPWGAYGIMALNNGDGFDTSVLIARNVAVVWLMVYVIRLAWRATRVNSPTPTHAA